jgi:hypothetical protein
MKIKTVLLISLLLCLFWVNLVSLITSRNKSNMEGYFKFDNLKMGEYSLLIFKEGYAPTAPIHVLKKYLSAELTPHFKAGELTPFYLKEGVAGILACP